jgi:alcohol dehydrogenase class IV
VQHNVDKGFTGYAGLYSTFEGADAGLSDLDASRAFAERLRAMTDTLQVPRVLNGFGVERSSIPLLAEETAKMTGQLNMNPFTFAIEEITATLEAMVE